VLGYNLIAIGFGPRPARVGSRSSSAATAQRRGPAMYVAWLISTSWASKASELDADFTRVCMHVHASYARWLTHVCFDTWLLAITMAHVDEASGGLVSLQILLHRVRRR
jgi:hypothetical protein